MSDIKTTRTQDINEFLSWHKRGELLLSPKYQRNSVWNQNAKSYLIDTILEGLPVPPIFIQQKIDVSAGKTFREVIDGQQRLRTILDYVDDKFPILKSHNKDYGDLLYSQLPYPVKEKILGFELSVEVIKTTDDAVIYDMFARLNTNSMTLNRQELRNAQYWGLFKVFVYGMTKRLKDLFINLGTFTVQQFARMQDAELVSGLAMLTIDGVLTETPTVINSYYKKYDDKFETLDIIEDQLMAVTAVIGELIDDHDFQTRFFHRKVAFYTLYAFLSHQMFGLPACELSRIDQLSADAILGNTGKLKNILTEFESYLERAQAPADQQTLDEEAQIRFSKFLDYHKSRTTSAKERRLRIQFLNDFVAERM